MIWNDEGTKKFALDLIRRLALSNTQICQYGGGIKVLCEAIVDPVFEGGSKVFTHLIIYLLNSPETRDHIMDHLQIPKIFSYFTDIDRNETAAQKVEDLAAFEKRLRLASNSILIFFKSWSGLIYLGNEKFSLKSLVEALRQPIKPIIRDCIFQLLEDILKIGVSLCPQEAEKSNCTVRRSLAQMAYIQTTLLKEAGLYDILLELSSVDNPEISLKAQYQLKLFSHMMFHLLPLDKVDKPDFLMNSINLDETQFDYLRSKCSTIFENMNTKLLKQAAPKTLKNEFLYKCEYFYLNMPYSFVDPRVNREVLDKIKLQDEGTVEDTKMSVYIKNFMNIKEWQRWNFQEILQILEGITNSNNQFQELCENHFFKKLIKFFQPSQHAFIDLPWRPENFIHAKVGYVLIKTLLKSQYGRKLLSQSSNENYFVVSKGFVAEIQILLDQDQKYLKQIKNQLTASSCNLTRPSATPNLTGSQIAPQPGASIQVPSANSVADQVLLNFESFNSTMLREFFSWIGLFTQSKAGVDLLIEQGIFETLKLLVKKSGSRDHLIRAVLLTLNYNFDGPKNFLVHCLSNGSSGLRICCMTIVKLLHQSEMSDLLSWAREPVLKQVSTKYEPVIDAALSTIDLLASDENSLVKILKDSKILINKKTQPLLMKYLNTEDGFDYLHKDGWIERQMKEWLEVEMLKYVENFDKRTMEYLDSTNENNQNKYEYKYISFHAETNPAFAQSPIYINSLLRLPWNILFQVNTAKGKMEKKLNIQVDYSWTEECLLVEGKISDLESAELVKLGLNVNKNTADTEWYVSLALRMGEVFLNNQCQQVTDPYAFKVDYYKRSNINAVENNPLQKHYDCNNLDIDFFEEGETSPVVKSITVLIKIKLSENNKSNSSFPHLFGCLSRTGYGVNYLRENEIAEKLFADLKHPDTKPNQKRADLWAIGSIGLSDFGMSYLSSIDGLMGHILAMVTTSENLSLKGTSLHVANMFAQTNMGRSALKDFQWEVNLLKQNEYSGSEFICIPPKDQNFLSFPKTKKPEPFQLKDEYWSLYYKLVDLIKKNLDDKGKEFFDIAMRLPNRITTGKTVNVTDITQNQEANIKGNTKLFFLIAMMLTFYNFPIQVRKNYYVILDWFFNLPNFLVLLDEDHDFDEFLKL
jgi:hypothetical protein